MNGIFLVALQFLLRLLYDILQWVALPCNKLFSVIITLLNNSLSPFSFWILIIFLIFVFSARIWSWLLVLEHYMWVWSKIWCKVSLVVLQAAFMCTFLAAVCRQLTFTNMRFIIYSIGIVWITWALVRIWCFFLPIIWLGSVHFLCLLIKRLLIL